MLSPRGGLWGGAGGAQTARDHPLRGLEPALFDGGDVYPEPTTCWRTEWSDIMGS